MELLGAGSWCRLHLRDLRCISFCISSLVFSGEKREGTVAVVVGAGLVVDARVRCCRLLLWAECSRIHTVGSQRRVPSRSLHGLDKTVSRR